MFTLMPFTNSHGADVIQVWNSTAHHDYQINERLLGYNTTPCTNETIEGRVAIQNNQVVGFVLACAVKNGALGWISLIAVHPSAQRQGIGSSLLSWAEGWVREMGCKRIRLGGNLRPFLPGLPYVMQANSVFFEQHGFRRSADQPYEYDIARSLKDYQSIYPRPDNVELRPMQPAEEHLLLEFMHREYPGRWEFETQEFVKNSGRASDYLLLHVNGNVQGFCRITFEDSERPIERFYPQRLPHPWGQYGPLGLSKSARGKGLGGYMIDAAALHMQSLGIDGCIIDWTSLVELYGKFGFTIYNQYISFFKQT